MRPRRACAGSGVCPRAGGRGLRGFAVTVDGFPGLGGGVRRPPRVLVLVPAAHGASGDGDTFVVTPGGAC